jgi:hypothetical protein
MMSKEEKLKTAVKYSKEILNVQGPMAAIVLCERLKRVYDMHDISAKELSMAIRRHSKMGIKSRMVRSERGFGNVCDSKDTLIYYVGKDREE